MKKISVLWNEALENHINPVMKSQLVARKTLGSTHRTSNILGIAGTISKNILRGITLAITPVWEIHSLTLKISWIRFISLFNFLLSNRRFLKNICQSRLS